LGNQRWYERLALSLLPEPVVDQSAAGRIGSTQLVNDASWMSSREGNPWAVWSIAQNTPGAGEHCFFTLTSSLPVAITGIGVYHLGWATVGDMNYAGVTQAGIVYSNGPTVLDPIWNDAASVSRLTFRFGEVLTANLPTAQGNFRGNNASGFGTFQSKPPTIFVGPGDSLAFWTSTTNQGLGLTIKAQSIAIPL
jgi:hypothetical protein